MCFLKFKGHLGSESCQRAFLIPGSAIFVPKRQEFGVKANCGRPCSPFSAESQRTLCCILECKNMDQMKDPSCSLCAGKHKLEVLGLNVNILVLNIKILMLNMRIPMLNIRILMLNVQTPDGAL